MIWPTDADACAGQVDDGIDSFQRRSIDRAGIDIPLDLVCTCCRWAADEADGSMPGLGERRPEGRSDEAARAADEDVHGLLRQVVGVR